MTGSTIRTAVLILVGIYLVMLGTAFAQGISDAERIRGLEIRLAQSEQTQAGLAQRIQEHTGAAGHSTLQKDVNDNAKNIAVLQSGFESFYRLLWVIVGGLVLNTLLQVGPTLAKLARNGRGG